MATSKMSLQPSIIAGQAISFLGMFAAYVSLYGEKDLAARSKAFKELQDGEAAANGLECAEAPASLRNALAEVKTRYAAVLQRDGSRLTILQKKFWNRGVDPMQQLQP